MHPRDRRLDPDLSSQDKKITIVHGGDKLLNDTYSDSFRRSMESKLRARKVDIILGEYVDQFPPSGSGELVFRSGEKINAGLVVSNSRVYTYAGGRFNSFHPGQDFRSCPEHRNDRRVPRSRRCDRAQAR